MSFTASATIIAMTMSEFSEPGNTAHIKLATADPVAREVKLICLPSDNMGDRGHIKMIIYIYYAIYTDN